jgi:ABC-type phosphate/phosphonate transport system substrate-binding protein
MSGVAHDGAARIAALPMYDLPEIRGANDALWGALATRLREAGIEGVPDRLTRDVPDLMALWTSPDLLFAQTCGYPLMTALRERVRLVAVPVYAVPGGRDLSHRSFLIVPADHPARALAELRGCRCALNSAESNTGMNLLRAVVAPLAKGAPFFGSVVTTGGHVASVGAVAEGRADLAAVDCITFAHLRRWRPALTERVRILAETPATPNLPLVTAARTEDATLASLRRALAETAADPGLAPQRDALFLAGFATPPPGLYDIVLALERSAAALNYPRLA